ncbi:potassium channel family protein [Blastococcus sp. HT6-30]|uniref:potassium channel family protein n=1 Tax=Blastococcus sp. HT6-30 TaxID=3144843 RepID=UPI00321B0D78
MEILFAVVGLLLVGLTIIDALWTALWVDGSAGPVTGRVTTWLWKGTLAVFGRRRHRRLSVFGPLVLVLTVLQWIVLLWAGWVCLFASDPDALMRSGGPGTADWTGRIWFVGYTMFTVGNGDFVPADGLWQVVSGLVALTGMSLITLAVTYLLSVVSAVVGKRAFASQVAGLGRSGEEFVLSGWNGRNLHPLDRQLTDLSSQLSRLTEQYLSYPVLQYYHAASPDKSPVKAAAVLDDALLLMTAGVPADQRPDPAALRTARSSVRTFLQDAQEAASIDAAPAAPPAPRLSALREQGVPTVADEQFTAAVAEQADRRRTMLGLVRGDGWNWEE